MIIKVSERRDVYLEVADWAAKKRDGAMPVPWTISRFAEAPWRDGYYTAMNEVAQVFNMKRLAEERK